MNSKIDTNTVADLGIDSVSTSETKLSVLDQMIIDSYVSEVQSLVNLLRLVSQNEELLTNKVLQSKTKLIRKLIDSYSNDDKTDLYVEVVNRLLLENINNSDSNNDNDDSLKLLLVLLTLGDFNVTGQFDNQSKNFYIYHVVQVLLVQGKLDTESLVVQSYIKDLELQYEDYVKSKYSLVSTTDTSSSPKRRRSRRKKIE